MVEVTQAEKLAKSRDCHAAGELGHHLCPWCEYEKMDEVVDAIRQRRRHAEQDVVDRIVAKLEALAQTQLERASGNPLLGRDYHLGYSNGFKFASSLVRQYLQEQSQ